MSGDDDDDWLDYESGPFCRHWSDIGFDCGVKCAKCGVACQSHWREELHETCPIWVEPEDSDY